MTLGFKNTTPWILLGLSTIGFAILTLKQQEQIVDLTRAIEASPQLLPQRVSSAGSGEDEFHQRRISSRKLQPSLTPKPEDSAQLELAHRCEAQFEASLERIFETYDPLYRELGLSSEERVEMVERIANIEEARALITEQSHQLGTLRLAYDQEMRRALSEPDYQRYREIEDHRHSERLLTGIAKLAQAKGLPPLTSAQQNKIRQDFVDFQGIAGSDDSFGPYGDLPSVTVGFSNIERTNNERLGRMEGERDQLIQLNPDAADHINHFYQERIAYVEGLTAQARKLDQELRQSRVTE